MATVLLSNLSLSSENAHTLKKRTERKGLRCSKTLMFPLYYKCLFDGTTALYTINKAITTFRIYGGQT